MKKSTHAKSVNDVERNNPRQIVTTEKNLKDIIEAYGFQIVDMLIQAISGRCIEYGYENCVAMAAMKLERISCLVTVGKNGKIEKHGWNYYMKNIFGGFAGTVKEVADRLEEYGVDREEAERVYRNLHMIAEAVCKMMAKTCEQAYVFEYAYVIDYVVEHDGRVEPPRVGELFPINWEDFIYDCSVALAKEIRKYEFAERVTCSPAKCTDSDELPFV